MTNTFMLAGEDDPEEILRSVDRGLYAVSFGGGQVDITSGKFVFAASEAYRIEDGRLGAPVKGATLIGNGPDVLTRVRRDRPRPRSSTRASAPAARTASRCRSASGLPTLRVDGPHRRRHRGVSREPRERARLARARRRRGACAADAVLVESRGPRGARARRRDRVRDAGAQPDARPARLRARAGRPARRDQLDHATSRRRPSSGSSTTPSRSRARPRPIPCAGLPGGRLRGGRARTSASSDPDGPRRAARGAHRRRAARGGRGARRRPAHHELRGLRGLVELRARRLRQQRGLPRRVRVRVTTASSSSRSRREDGAMQRDYWITPARRSRALEEPGRGRPPRRRARAAAARRAPREDLRGAGGLRGDHRALAARPPRRLRRPAARSTGRRRSSPAGSASAIASERVTVVDDGRRPGGLASRPFDGEGLPTRRTVVVERGVLRSYLLDTYSARKLGLALDRAAPRAARAARPARRHELLARARRTRLEEIIASTERGLLVTELIGFGFNPVTGDYSRGAAGLWIEDGRVAFPVEEITIAGQPRRDARRDRRGRQRGRVAGRRRGAAAPHRRA